MFPLDAIDGSQREFTFIEIGGEYHDSDKEYWNAFAGNLAHLDWPDGCAGKWNSNDAYFAGYSRYCCRRLYPDWQVSCPFRIKVSTAADVDPVRMPYIRQEGSNVRKLSKLVYNLLALASAKD